MAGYHFGDVAVKFLNMDHTDEGKKLDDFKADVAAHKVGFFPTCKNRKNQSMLKIVGRTFSFHKLEIFNLCEKARI